MSVKHYTSKSQVPALFWLFVTEMASYQNQDPVVVKRNRETKAKYKLHKPAYFATVKRLKEDIKQFGSTHYVFRSTYETKVLKRDRMDTRSYTIWEHRSVLRSFNEYKNYHDTLNPEDAGSSDVDLMWDFLQERDW